MGFCEEKVKSGDVVANPARHDIAGQPQTT